MNLPTFMAAWPGRTFVGTWPGRIVAIIVVAGLVGGASLVVRGNAPAPAPALRTATVTRASVTQTVSVSGSVNAFGQARLSFKTGGKLAQVFVVTGQAVTLGQRLAKLDTTDLETALATAQQNLASAQASYQKQVLAAADTRAAFNETQKSSANAIANAQQALSKVKTNYAAAKFNYTSFTNIVRGDAASLQSSIDTLRNGLSALLQLVTNGTQSNDVRAATNSLNQAQVALNNASAYSTTVLTSALADLGSAQRSILQVAGTFDDAIAAGSDTNGIASAFQTQEFAYTTAAARVSSAIDFVTAPLNGAQSGVASAQAALTTSAAASDPSLEGDRASTQALLVQISTQVQSAATTKSRIGQASTALTTMNDAVQGGYVSAVQAVATANDQAAQSLRNAQSSVANIPFNLQSAQVSVDNSQNALVTAQSNLDAAVLTAPAMGIVASIANQVGEFVSGGNTNSAFIVLTNTTSMVLHGTIGEADVAKLKLGQVANITVDALTSQKMTGKVTSLDPVATISQGVPVYGIDVAIDVPSTTLKAGMSGTASVILASKTDVLTVPNTTIRTVNGQRGVQILKGGEVIDTAATFGLANDTVTEVVSGLAEGDTVVIPQARASASGQPNRGVQIGGPGGGGFGR